jgi:hypothetical protein
VGDLAAAAGVDDESGEGQEARAAAASGPGSGKSPARLGPGAPRQQERRPGPERRGPRQPTASTAAPLRPSSEAPGRARPAEPGRGQGDLPRPRAGLGAANGPRRCGRDGVGATRWRAPHRRVVGCGVRANPDNGPRPFCRRRQVLRGPVAEPEVLLEQQAGEEELQLPVHRRGAGRLARSGTTRPTTARASRAQRSGRSSLGRETPRSAHRPACGIMEQTHHAPR